MSCFNVQILPPSGTVLEVETCTQQNLIISECSTSLPVDINDQINSYLVAGSGIVLTEDNINNHLIISVSGDLGLTAEQVDDRVSSLLVAGTGIVLNYNDSGNSLTISTTGLQPSGNYSLVGHTHLSTDISDSTSFGRNILTASSYAEQNRLLWEPLGTSDLFLAKKGGRYINKAQNLIPAAPIFDVIDPSDPVDGDYYIIWDQGGVYFTIGGLDGETYGGAYANTNQFILRVYESAFLGDGSWKTQLLNRHNHTASQITDFNSSVSGLLPVKNILAGSGIGVSSSSGNFTISVTGTFGLTSEQVDDRVNNLLVAGNGINLNYNDNANTLTINTSGLQPSGNYSLVGHTHTSNDITDFNNSVSGLIPVTNIVGKSGIQVATSGTTKEVSTNFVAGYGISLNYNYDQSITISTISSNGFIQITDDSTTNITIPNGYTIGSLSIYQNGVKLLDGIDYTAVDGSGVVFNLPPSSGSYIEYLTSAAANNDIKNSYDTPIYNLGTASGIVPINYDIDRTIQTVSLDTNTVTFTKGTGWPTSNVSRDVVLQITCINPATIVWSIVGNNWYNQPVNPLASGEYMVLLRAVGSGVVQGHYIGEKKGSL